MEIIQESGKSYLCVEYNEESEYVYMVRMLTDNNIQGSPLCRKGLYQNKEVLKYDITNMKSLRREYENRVMHFGDLKWLLYGISEILTVASEYLLDERYYVYDPDHMYIDMESGRLHMICIPFPCRENTGEGRYHILADYLLEKIEHREESAVNIAYQFYRMSKEELFSIIGFCSLIDKESVKEGTGSEPYHKPHMQPTDDIKEADIEKDDLLLTQEIKEPADTGKKPMIISAAALILSIILYITVGKNSIYSAQMTVGLMMIGAVCICIIGKCVVKHIKRVKDQELKREMAAGQATVNEYWGGDEQTVLFDEETRFFGDMAEDNKAVGTRGCTIEWEENGVGRRESVSGSTILLGKKFDEVDVCITDPTVSRKHAKVILKKDGVFLQDLGSTNGTYVAGRKLGQGEEIKLCDDRDFLLGKVAVRVV